MLTSLLIFFGILALLGVAIGVVLSTGSAPDRKLRDDSTPFYMRPPQGWENLSGAEYEETEVERIEEAFALDDYDRLFGDEAYSRAEERPSSDAGP
jgi:hypothetical protein